MNNVISRRFLPYQQHIDSVKIVDNIIENTPGTTLEYLVVVDIDADGHAEILVGSTGSTSSGLRAFEAANDNWVSTRSIWNQHTYHINNITGALFVFTSGFIFLF